MVAVFAIFGVALWLGPAGFCYGCFGTLELRVDGIAFGSNGLVAFHITNPTSLNVTFITVNAYVDPATSRPTNSTQFVSVPLSTNNVVPVGGALLISIHVQGVTWQIGARYSFELITSHGNAFPYYGCLGGC